MAGKSVWREAVPFRHYPALRRSLSVDVAIIGGGLTGIIAAYLLKDSGLSVVVLEGSAVGSFASGSTTGFLMELVDAEAQELLSTRGEAAARAVLASHRDAISFYEETIKRENISCEYMRCPVYKHASERSAVAALRQEVSALNLLGAPAQWREDTALRFAQHGYFLLPGQAKLHPLKFLFALSNRVGESGVVIHEESVVQSIEERGDKLVLTTAGGGVKATHVLMATHYPLKPQPPQLFFKKGAYLTYVLEAKLPKNTLPEALFEDTQNPYHYLRVDKQGGHDRLILGGADHRLDIPVPEEKNFAALKRYLQNLLPGVEYTIAREWKGRIVESGDGLAFLGPLGKSPLFYATGYSGSGLTYAVIAAKLFGDFVLGKKNELQNIYAADRAINLKAYGKSAAHYLEEFLNGAIKNSFS